MNKIMCIVGLQGTSKDTILNELVKHHMFRPLISYTTRHKRPSETDGKEYFFISEQEFNLKLENDFFIETRRYNTFIEVDGKKDKAVFSYGLPKNQVEDLTKPLVVILDKNGLLEFSNYIGSENIVVILLECDEEVTKKRVMDRGGVSEDEFNRRNKADKISFKGIENISDAIINTNQPVDEIVQQVLECYNYYN